MNSDVLEEKFADAPVRPLKRWEYDRLVALGAFSDERLELLEGHLVTMSPQGTKHAAVVQKLMELLVPALLGRARVRVQMPLGASDSSEPEPDIAVVPAREYLDDHPTSAHLVIEVADSTLKKDRAKARIYASMGATEYWIVNLEEGVLEVHRAPAQGMYTSVERLGRDESIRPLDFPELTLSVSELLPTAGN